MGKPLENPTDTLYERDFYAWTQDQAATIDQALDPRFLPGKPFAPWEVIRD